MLFRSESDCGNGGDCDNRSEGGGEQLPGPGPSQGGGYQRDRDQSENRYRGGAVHYPVFAAAFLHEKALRQLLPDSAPQRGAQGTERALPRSDIQKAVSKARQPVPVTRRFRIRRYINKRHGTARYTAEKRQHIDLYAVFLCKTGHVKNTVKLSDNILNYIRLSINTRSCFLFSV